MYRLFDDGSIASGTKNHVRNDALLSVKVVFTIILQFRRSFRGSVVGGSMDAQPGLLFEGAVHKVGGLMKKKWTRRWAAVKGEKKPDEATNRLVQCGVLLALLSLFFPLAFFFGFRQVKSR